jgi:signal transduction histidine kinase
MQRLQLALDKLQQPTPDPRGHCALGQWWRLLCERYEGQEIVFRADIGDDALAVPGDCFDSVVENLIDNARNKAKIESGLTLGVHVTARDGRVTLAVSDDGTAIEPGVAARLFEQPLTSENGLGVGLYQAARQAALVGYRIRLAENRDGEVRFELATDGGE